MGKRFELRCEVWVPAPIDEVWQYFTNVKNLEKLTPPEYGGRVEILGAPSQPLDGMKLKIESKPFGWFKPPVAWIAAISDVQPQGSKRQFVDVQQSGPFKFWKHTHSFESARDSVLVRGQPVGLKGSTGTWVRDLVEYEMPLAFVGQIAHGLIVRRLLESMFVYRVRVLTEEVFKEKAS